MPICQGAQESVPSRGGAIFASWSTGRWDLTRTLEGRRWVRQDRGMTLGGRRVHMDLSESGAQYGSMYDPSGNSLHNYEQDICHHGGEHMSESKLPE